MVSWFRNEFLTMFFIMVVNFGLWLLVSIVSVEASLSTPGSSSSLSMCDEGKKLLKAKLDPVMSKMLSYRQDSNVHSFNKDIVRPNVGIVDDIVSALGLEAKQDYTNSMLGCISKVDVGDRARQNMLMSAIAKFKKHRINDNEVETTLVIANMLSYIYGLRCLMNNYTFDGYMANSFIENIETRGGCWAGYAGRLFRDLVCLTFEYLDMIYS